MNEIEVIFKSPTFWAIFVPALVGVITFYLSKAAERESEWRKEKLRLYLSFVEALSGITDCEKSIENDIKFAKACNDLHALSPQQVLKALHRYQETMAISNTSSTPKEKQIALNMLMLEMRKDLKVKPKDKKSEFQMLLWTSGRKKDL
ncbi:MAG: hypothetical protein H6936_14250 [Burkholderiales bacterium]|nr:hypothetical protein [Nitrosomonas sp.]MCP5275979.1 hypothetical protein [Burkholderiales bacterium]